MPAAKRSLPPLIPWPPTGDSSPSPSAADPESERQLDEKVDALVDSLLGPPPASCAAAGTLPAAAASLPASPSAATAAAAERQTCAICMDAAVRVAVVGCRHPLCFTCARRLCAGQVRAGQAGQGWTALPLPPARLSHKLP